LGVACRPSMGMGEQASMARTESAVRCPQGLAQGCSDLARRIHDWFRRESSVTVRLVARHPHDSGTVLYSVDHTTLAQSPSKAAAAAVALLLYMLHGHAGGNRDSWFENG